MENKKRCPQCSEWKDKSEFGTNRARYDGLASMCKQCWHLYSKKVFKKNYVPHPRISHVFVLSEDGNVVTKRCPDCGEYKTPDQFHKNATLRFGMAIYCIECANKHTYKSKASYRERFGLTGNNREIIVSQQDANRFWLKVDIRGNNECWKWKGYINPWGYGVFGLRTLTFPAHRVAWVLANGRQIRKGMDIGHAPIVCHNPSCCNPNHLRELTDQENTEDKKLDGTICRGDKNGLRMHPELAARGESSGVAKLTESQVREIRNLYATGNYTQRQLAKIYKVSPSRICDIINKKTWTHIV